MKLNRYALRRLIEGIVSEDSDPSKFRSEKGSEVPFEEYKSRPEKDNNRAHKFLDAEEARKKYNIPGSGDYYVYRSAKGDVKIGDVRYSKGDPYTYKSEGGGEYRVMSGPYNTGTRPKSGKVIGTTPIGAVFKPSSPPTIKIKVDPFAVLKGLKETAATRQGFKDSAVNAAQSYLTQALDDDMKASNILSVLRDKFSELKPPNSYGGPDAIKLLCLGTIAYAGEQSSGQRDHKGTSKNKKIFKQFFKAVMGPNTRVDFFDKPRVGLTKSGIQHAKNVGAKDSEIKSLDGKPDAGGGQAANESLSRGSLLRRRYRRY